MQMVAPSLMTDELPVSPPQAGSWGRLMIRRFDRREVELLMRAGVIPEDATIELLEGLLIYKDRAAEGEAITTIGTDHTLAVELLSKLRSPIDTSERHVRSQQPLVCRQDDVPEPDFMVLRGTLRSYVDLPTAADAFCVVEVADSSYERDTGMKRTIYARAGLPQYIVINLRNRTAEVYTEPDASTGKHGSMVVVPGDSMLSLRVGVTEMFTLPLADVLP